jgi:hypothetical protein
VGAFRDRVGWLCDQLNRWPDLVGIIEEAEAGAPLRKLQDALANATKTDPVHITELLQDIQEACARHGLTGVTQRDRAYQPLPPGMSDPSGTDAWVCPRGVCDRVVLAEETTTEPVCAIAAGTPMARFALPPRDPSS